VEDKNYPNRVCRECGLKASGGKAFTLSTFHKNICDVCGEEKHVTEPRDFFYPIFEGFERREFNEEI